MIDFKTGDIVKMNQFEPLSEIKPLSGVNPRCLSGLSQPIECYL